MTTPEARLLEPGLYRLIWKSGGYSLASVGALANGDRWFAPTNFKNGKCAIAWDLIERVECVPVLVMEGQRA